MRTTFLQFLEEQPKALLWVEALGLLFFCGAFDYWTGYEVSVVPFYALPILLVVWFGDRKSGVFMAVLCAVVWWWADIKAGHPYIKDWVQVWDTLMRLSMFLLVVLAGVSVKSRLEMLTQSRDMEHEIVRISEREQRRIGCDLHDGLCQYFAAVGCAAGSLKQKLARIGAAEADAAAEIESLIMQGVEQTRDLARGLSPVSDEEGGLRSAIEELAAGVSKLSKLDCRLEGDCAIPVPDHLIAGHLFRITQEAVNNASKHGQAKSVMIRLEREDHRLALSIQDDGRGFLPRGGDGKGMGLKIMNYRAHAIGGDLRISSRPNQGTLVRCTVPWPADNLPPS